MTVLFKKCCGPTMTEKSILTANHIQPLNNARNPHSNGNDLPKRPLVSCRDFFDMKDQADFEH